MIRLVFLITAIRSHIEIHSDVGVTTQEINDAYITRRDYQRLKVYVPVEFRVPPGPLKAETQARLHEELVDLHDKLGLDDYVVNSTSEVYACTRPEKKPCEEGYSPVKQGEARVKKQRVRTQWIKGVVTRFWSTTDRSLYYTLIFGQI